MPHSKTEPVTRNCDLLIHNAHVITMNSDRDVFPSGAVAVAWIPGNVMYWGTGGKTRGPMPELHRRGGRITLGMDMAKAWAFGDVSLIAYLLARMQGEYMPVETLLEMLTIGAARAGIAPWRPCWRQAT